LTERLATSPGLIRRLEPAKARLRLQGRGGRYPLPDGGYWLKENLNGNPDDLLVKCPLWLTQSGPKPVLRLGWKKYTLWHYTEWP
jgi:hypothetical protein